MPMREVVAEIVSVLVGLGIVVVDDGTGRTSALLDYAGNDRYATVRIADAALSGPSAPAAPTVELAVLYVDHNPREADERACADAAQLLDALVDPTEITDAVLIPPVAADGLVQLGVQLDVLLMRTAGGDLHDDIEHEGAGRAVLEGISRGLAAGDALGVSRPLTPADLDDARTLWSTELQLDIDHHADQTWASARAEIEQRLADEAGLLFEAVGPGLGPAEVHLDRASRLTVLSVAGGELSRPAPGAALLEMTFTCYEEGAA